MDSPISQMADGTNLMIEHLILPSITKMLSDKRIALLLPSRTEYSVWETFYLAYIRMLNTYYRAPSVEDAQYFERISMMSLHALDLLGMTPDRKEELLHKMRLFRRKSQRTEGASSRHHRPISRAAWNELQERNYQRGGTYGPSVTAPPSIYPEDEGEWSLSRDFNLFVSVEVPGITKDDAKELQAETINYAQLVFDSLAGHIHTSGLATIMRTAMNLIGAFMEERVEEYKPSTPSITDIPSHWYTRIYNGIKISFVIRIMLRRGQKLATFTIYPSSLPEKLDIKGKPPD